MSEDEKFQKLNWEMFQEFLNKNPHYGTLFGLHDPYDRLMPEGSSKNVFDTLEVAKQWVDQMKKTIKYDALNNEHRMDWKVIEHFYELQKFLVEQHRTWETNPDAFEEIGGVLFVMLTRNYAPLEKRVEAITSRLEKLPSFLEQFRTRFEKSQPVKLWTEVAIESCQQIPGLLQFIVTATKGMILDELHNRLLKAVMNLQQPIKQHLEWLQNLLPKAKTEWAIGKEKLEKLLQIRKLGMTSDEIYEVGVKNLKELKEERARLAAKISPGKSVEEVMKQIEARAPKTFEDALKTTSEEMEKSRRFIIEHDLATVPKEDQLLVEETPTFMAPLIPFAALIPAGKFEKKQIGIYIVTRPRM